MMTEQEVPADNGLPKPSWKDMVTGNLDLPGLSDPIWLDPKVTGAA